MMTTLAVIQARSGSTRFPRKVLAPLQGRPLLAHVIERVSRATLIDGVVVATTAAPRDDDVESLALRSGAYVTRGPEDDVLSRYLLAAREHGAGVIVRITADCPLVDPAIVDLVIRARAGESADYASNVAPPTYPDGYDVEALTAECLFRIDRDATLAYEREHVTIRVREHLDEYRTAQVRNDRDLSWMRLTVDLPEDLDRVARLLASLPATPPPGLAEVVAAYERDPALHADPLPPRDQRYHEQRDAARGTPRPEESRPA
jgi:spore coat polysaccharide biosynthesis protein SpsF (cytidylyltransferase family)